MSPAARDAGAAAMASAIHATGMTSIAWPVQASRRMLRGEIPIFPELLGRIALLEQQCNAIARSVS